MRVKIITKATGKVREVELLPGQTLTIADGEQLLIPENWVVSRQGDTVVIRDPAEGATSTATVRLEDSNNGLVFADAGVPPESGLGAGALWLLGGAAGAATIALAAGGGGGGSGGSDPQDSTAPGSPIISGVSEDSNIVGDQITKDATITLTGSAEPGSRVTIFDGTVELGQVTADGNGNWTFTTPQLSDGTHQLNARATDDAGNVSVASNAVPVTVDTIAPAPGTLALSGRDGDSDGSFTLVPTGAEPGAALVFQISTDGGNTWTPTGAAQNNLVPGSYSFRVIATDVAGNQSISNVQGVTVTTPGDDNVAPVATDAAFSVSEDGPSLSGSVSATDADGDALTYSLVGAAPAGLSFNSNGSFGFNPGGAFQGLDTGETATVTFQYRANDGQANSNIATVTLTINGANDAPVANGDSFSTIQNQQLSIPAGLLLGNDVDVDGEALNIAGVTSGTGGTVSLDGGVISFTPTPGFVGAATFSYTATDGSAASNPATVTVIVGTAPPPTNVAPVANDDSASVGEDGPLLMGNVSASDANGDTLTYSPFGPLPGGVLLSSNGSFTFDPGLNYQYLNNNESATVTFQFQANDGQLNSNVGTFTITVNGADEGQDGNDAPVLSVDGTAVYIENTLLGTVLDSSITLTDADDTQMMSATVTISAGLTAGDLLNFTNQNGITGSYVGGTLTLSGLASIADYTTALQSITYSSTSEDPTATSATRTISWTVTDANSDAAGAATSTVQLSTVTVTPVNDAPVLSVDGTAVYIENTLLGTVLDSSITLTDADDTQMMSATVTISAGLTAGDLLNFTNQNGITGSYVGGTLTLSGLASIADYTTALQSITYSSTSEDPTATSATRTISWTVTDANSDAAGAATSTVQLSTVTVTPVNDAPVLSVDGTAVYIENTLLGTVLDSSITLTDADDTQMMSATVTISAGLTAGDLLNFTNQNGITGSYVGGTLTLSGLASIADYTTALQSITYSSTSEDPTATSATRTISWTVTDANSDAAGAATSTVQLSTVTVTPVNDAPVLSVDGTAVYIENTLLGTVLDSSITLTDADDTQMMSATVTISAGLTAGDLLNFTNQNGITGSYVGGTLTLSGLASIADYTTALQSITYSSTSEDPTATSATRTISWTVTDANSDAAGAATSTVQLSTVTVTPVNDEPTLTATGANPTFTEGTGAAQGALVSVFSGGAVASTVEASQTITSLTFTVGGLTNGTSEQVRVDGTTFNLTAGTTGTTATNGLTYTVSGTAAAVTVVLSSAGGISASNAGTVVSNIQYQNTSNDPTGANRVFTLTQITDSGSNVGQNDNTAALNIVSTVTVTPVNDEPTLTATGANPTFTEGTGAAQGALVSVFSGGAVASTVEASQTITSLTFTVGGLTNGTSEQVRVDGTTFNLTAGTTGTTATNGLTYTVSGTAAAVTVVLSSAGGISASNAGTVVSNIQYQNTSNDPTGANRVFTLTQITDSGSNVGQNDNTAALNIVSTVTVTPVNDEPTLTATGANPTFTEGTGAAQGALVSVFSGGAVASTVEASQTITSLTFTVGGLTNGTSEQVRVDGTTFNLTAGTTGTTATNGLTYTVSGTAAAVTVVLSSAGGISASNAGTVVSNIQYQNTSNDPTGANRVFTLTQITDSGSNVGQNDNTAALNIVSTVTVVAINDAPMAPTTTLALITNAGQGGSVTFTEAALAAYFTDADNALIGVNTPTATAGTSLTIGTVTGLGAANVATVGTIMINDSGGVGGTNNGTFSVTATDGLTDSTTTILVTLDNNTTGTTTLSAAAGNSIVVANQTSATILNGLGGNDFLIGNIGNDTLSGGDGNDILIGGVGIDTLTGGNGTDQFRYNLTGTVTNDPVGGIDLITDFVTGMSGDRIGISQGFVNFTTTDTSTAGTTLNAADYLLRASIVNINSATDNDTVIELSSALSTSDILSLRAPGTGTTEAFVLVFNSTTNRGELWYDPRWETNLPNDLSARFQIATFDSITTLAQLNGFENTNFVQFS